MLRVLEFKIINQINDNMFDLVFRIDRARFDHFLLGTPLTINHVKLSSIAKGLKDTLSCHAMPDPSDQNKTLPAVSLAAGDSSENLTLHLTGFVNLSKNIFIVLKHLKLLTIQQ